MTSTIQLQLLLATFSGWIGLRQARAISYLIEENRVLKEQLESSGKRMLFTDDVLQRSLVAAGTANFAIVVIVKESFVGTDDEVLCVPAIQPDQHG